MIHVHEQQVSTPGQVKAAYKVTVPQVDLKALQGIDVVVEDVDTEANQLSVHNHDAVVTPLGRLKAPVLRRRVDPADDMLALRKLLPVGHAVLVRLIIECLKIHR